MMQVTKAEFYDAMNALHKEADFAPVQHCLRSDHAVRATDGKEYQAYGVWSYTLFGSVVGVQRERRSYDAEGTIQLEECYFLPK